MTYQVDLDRVAELHSQGLTNRKIAAQLNVPHWIIANRLRQLGLETNGRKRGVREVDGDQAKCSVCGGWFPIDSFPKGRSGKSDWYYLTYCSGCRHAQMNERLNSNVETFIADKWQRLRVRSKRIGALFLISKNDFLDQWRSQGGICFYTDIPLIARAGEGKHPNSVSIDKIVPHLGYVSGNVVFAANRVNSMKHDASLDEMALWMPSWHERAIAHLAKDGI